MSSRLAAFGTAAAVFLLDRVTKQIIQSYVSMLDTYVVIPGFFHIIHTENRGIAFGLLSETEGEWRTFFLVGLSALVLAFVASILWQSSPATRGRGLRFGLSLVFGGALGNLYDRAVHGTVTDFLDFYVGQHHWPAFNVADAAITIGAGLLLLDMWRSRKEATGGK